MDDPRYEELRQFTRDLLTRFERRTDAMIRRLDAQTDQLRALTSETREHTEWMKAQRQGFLALIDEIRGGPAGA